MMMDGTTMLENHVTLAVIQNWHQKKMQKQNQICQQNCYICKITRAIFSLVKAGLLYLINYIIVYLCIVSSYKEEPCDEAAHW